MNEKRMNADFNTRRTDETKAVIEDQIDAITKEAANQIVRLNATLAICSDELQREEFSPVITAAIHRALEPWKASAEASSAEFSIKCAELTEAIEILKDIEWMSGTTIEAGIVECPMCGNRAKNGHAPGCRLAKAIGK